jgi:hypothetical protein
MTRMPRAAEALLAAGQRSAEDEELDCCWDDGKPAISFEPERADMRQVHRRHLGYWTQRRLGNSPGRPHYYVRRLSHDR